MRPLIACFGVAYPVDKVFFEPFPQDLVDVLDFGKGRDVR